MNYFQTVEDRGFVWSVDKLILDFEFQYDKDTPLKPFDKFMYSDHILLYRYWMSTGMGVYRYQYSFDCQNGNSFWVGLGFNQPFKKPNFRRGRIEFNPNKVADDPVFIKIFQTLFSMKCAPPKIVRYDLACDIPFERSDVFLQKDKRTYMVIKNSNSNCTEYLGQKDASGRVKVYNKQLESNLSDALTRIEITLAGDLEYPVCRMLWPNVFYIGSGQMRLDGMKLTGTDRYILLTSFSNMELFGLLGYYERKKIERIRAEYVQPVEFIEPKLFNKIVSILDLFVKWEYRDVVINPLTFNYAIDAGELPNAET